MAGNTYHEPLDLLQYLFIDEPGRVSLANAIAVAAAAKARDRNKTTSPPAD